GDFNSSTNYYVNYYWNSTLATDITYPRDQNGNFKTNASRRRHYDWVLVDKKFQEFSVPTQIGSQTFPNGYVLDSRVHSPLSEISPVEYDDSDAPNMQHMPVIRDFMIAY
ncbi:MAG: endonuclease, partial [Proteobacteria bacterium]|nr:endonuclease [Pseudomonadota bacterium]